MQHDRSTRYCKVAACSAHVFAPWPRLQSGTAVQYSITACRKPPASSLTQHNKQQHHTRPAERAAAPAHGEALSRHGSTWHDEACPTCSACQEAAIPAHSWGTAATGGSAADAAAEGPPAKRAWGGGLLVAASRKCCRLSEGVEDHLLDECAPVHSATLHEQEPEQSIVGQVDAQRPTAIRAVRLLECAPANSATLHQKWPGRALHEAAGLQPCVTQ